MLISATCKELCLIAIDSGMLHTYVNERSCTLTELLRRCRARVIDLQSLPLSVGDLSLSIVYNPPLSCLLLFFDHPYISLYNLFIYLSPLIYLLLLSIPSRHSSTYSLKWFSTGFNLAFSIVSNKSKEIAEIVSNAYKGDHNNYFAAESLRVGDEKAWLREAI